MPPVIVPSSEIFSGIKARATLEPVRAVTGGVCKDSVECTEKLLIFSNLQKRSKIERSKNKLN